MVTAMVTVTAMVMATINHLEIMGNAKKAKLEKIAYYFLNYLPERLNYKNLINS